MISEFPLFLFTTLGGLSAGLAIAYALFPPKEKSERPWLVPLVAIVLLGVGLLGVLFHLGRPEMFYIALRNPAAGIAQEAYCSMVFGVLLLVWLVMAWRKGEVPRVVTILAAVAGLVLTCIMGGAYIVNVGTPAWSNWSTAPLFVIGDLAMGFGLWGFMNKAAYEARPFAVVSAVIDALFAVTLVLEGMHFGTVDQGGAGMYVAAVLALAAAVASFASGKKSASGMAAIVCVLAIVAVCVARWTFYAACLV